MQTRVRRDAVLRFLFKDKQFPRAVRHCLNMIEGCLEELKNNEQPLKRVRTLVRKVERRNVETLDQAALHGYIDDLQLNITSLHSTLAETYFPKSVQQQEVQ